MIHMHDARAHSTWEQVHLYQAKYKYLYFLMYYIISINICNKNAHKLNSLLDKYHLHKKIPGINLVLTYYFVLQF